MSSAIGGIGGYSQPMMMQGMRRPPQQDSAKMAEDLFSKLDTKGQGYIEQGDLESALSGLSDSGDASAEDIFSALDGDSDGKLTQSELADGLKKLEQELRSQYDSMRMQMGGTDGSSGMPPPPPGGPGGSDSGFTEDELTAQLAEMGSTDSKRSGLIADIVANFDQADSDGDGKVTAAEARAYAEAGGSDSGTGDGSGDAAATSGSQDLNAQVMAQIMRLMESYGLMDGQASGSTVSLTA